MATTRLTKAQTLRAMRRFGIEESTWPAFGLVDANHHTRYAAHAHRRHQLLLPLAGLLLVETNRRLQVCAPSLGLWIPAGTRHATTTRGHSAVSVFLDPVHSDPPLREVTVVPVSPLLRELALTASGRTPASDIGKALATLLRWEIERSAHHSPIDCSLTRPRSEELGRAATLILDHLETVNVASLARMAGWSERTLRRRFLQETRLSPEAYIQRMRLIRAMQLLTDDPERPIVDTSLAVGYGSQSAFSAAFRRFAGVTPRAFRERLGQAAS